MLPGSVQSPGACYRVDLHLEERPERMNEVLRALHESFLRAVAAVNQQKRRLVCKLRFHFKGDLDPQTPSFSLAELKLMQETESQGRPARFTSDFKHLVGDLLLLLNGACRGPGPTASGHVCDLPMRVLGSGRRRR